MSITAGQCFETLRDAIVDVVVTQRSKEDALWYFEGDPSQVPLTDRALVIVPTEHPRELTFSGCGQRKITFEIRVVYLQQQGYIVRMLNDGDAMITAIWSLFSSDIVNVEEPVTDIVYLDGYAIYGRTVVLDYLSSGA